MVTQLEQYQEKCFCIFITTWTTHKSVGITAQVLATTFIEVLNPISRAYLYETQIALHRCATVYPTSIDFLLRVYDKFCKLLPQDVKIEKDTGEKAARKELRWWLLEFADRWDPSYEHMVGHRDLADNSIMRFSADEVNSKTEDVLARMEEWRESRTRFITSMAILGRCFALDIVRESGGNQAAGLISASFTRHASWTQADFIANCFLLRGCAKALLEHFMDGDAKLKEFAMSLKVFLTENSNDFGSNYHATLALRNLTKGPWDESSEGLFEAARWVF